MSNPVNARMNHVCRVLRNEATVDTEIRAQTTPDWQPLESAQKCFFYASSGQEIIDSKVVVVQQLRMFLPLGVQYTEKDRVDSITDLSGTSLFEGVLEIRSILPHHTHLEVDLVRTH